MVRFTFIKYYLLAWSSKINIIKQNILKIKNQHQAKPASLPHMEFVGLKDLAKPISFHIESKAHAKEEEMSEDEWRESRLPGYT